MNQKNSNNNRNFEDDYRVDYESAEAVRQEINANGSILRNKKNNNDFDPENNPSM